jgi:SAM-dependent methyltransferase
LTDADMARIFTEVDAGAGGVQAAVIQALDDLAALPAIRRVRQVARASLQVSVGQRLLDAGCGLGEEASELAHVVGPDGEVTAVDLSEALVATASLRDAGNVRYEAGDIMALNFPDAVFDRVRSERVIQHLPDPDAAVAELARVTVPGGRVCLIDTDWDSFLMDGMPADLLTELTRLAASAGGTFGPAGRLLRGRLVQAGLTSVTAEPVAIAMTDRHTVQTLNPFFNPRVINDVMHVPPRLADPWFAAFEDALTRDNFLAVLTMWVVTGTKAA